MEHRAAAAPEPVWLRLADEDQERIHLEVISGEVEEEEKQSLADAILGTLAGGATLTRTELRQRLRVQNSRLGDMLAVLERKGRIVRVAGGWRSADSGEAEPPSKGAA
jgi:hypothetical protein